MFTPGPWNVNKKVHSTVEQTSAGQGMNIICHTEDPDGIRKREEDHSNARLIATAPEMYELLTSLRDEIKPYFADEYVKIVTLLAKVNNYE